MQIRTDKVCPLCQEDEETVLHLLGECSALVVKRANILGSPYLCYEELGKMHWCAQKLLSDFKALGMWGCALGPLEASALMATSPRKEERKLYLNY